LRRESVPQRGIGAAAGIAGYWGCTGPAHRVARMVSTETRWTQQGLDIRYVISSLRNGSVEWCARVLRKAGSGEAKRDQPPVPLATGTSRRLDTK
jgi:hypothetical protein